MDALRTFLEDLQRHGLERGHTLGLVHVLIGRRIQRTDGTAVVNGLTFREVANLFKKTRWDKEAVRDVGLDPDALPMRDREQYWYAAICRAQVDSAAARAAGDQFAAALQPLGYQVGPAPGGG